MKIAVGSDHAGFALKQMLVEDIKSLGHDVEDFGSYTPAAVDFPIIAQKVGTAVLTNQTERGIMFCGTGIGAAIACNKIPGIRAAVCHDIYSAHQCVEHDNVQILCLGGQVIGHTVAFELIRQFLDARFSESPEFRRRVAMLDDMEQYPKSDGLFHSPRLESADKNMPL